MPLPVFEQAYLLQSLGWAIANSFWQAALLWILYQFITHTDKKLPAVVKYQLSILLLATSFTWFLFTLQQNYQLLAGGATNTRIFSNVVWATGFQSVNAFLPYLSSIYLLLLFFNMVRFSRHLAANDLLQKERLNKAPIDFRLFVSRTALHLGIKKKVQVWFSDRVDVPSVTGFLKPVILLPAAIISNLSVAQMEAVLLHELAHIKRNDYLVNFFQSIIELTLFFNPFAILLSKAAKKERENCCDDWVMNFQYDNYEYANALLVLEERRHFLQSGFALTATNGRKNLLQRVKRLFNTNLQTDFSRFQKIKLAGLCLLLVFLVFLELPNVFNKQVDISSKYQGKNLIKSEFSVSNDIHEVSFKKVIANQPEKPVPEKKKAAVVVIKNKARVPKANDPLPGDYVNAYINEELLHPAVAQLEPLISQAVEKEVNNSKYFVRIEEQQSGKKQTNTYYFELNDKNGTPAVKPLIILNRTKIPLIKKITQNLPLKIDSLTKLLISSKRKITS